MKYTFNNITYHANLHRETTKEGGLVFRQHCIELQSDEQDIEIPITGEEYEELTETPDFLIRAFIKERLNGNKYKFVPRNIEEEDMQKGLLYPGHEIWPD